MKRAWREVARAAEVRDDDDAWRDNGAIDAAPRQDLTTGGGQFGGGGATGSY